MSHPLEGYNFPGTPSWPTCNLMSKPTTSISDWRPKEHVEKWQVTYGLDYTISNSAMCSAWTSVTGPRLGSSLLWLIMNCVNMSINFNSANQFLSSSRLAFRVYTLVSLRPNFNAIKLTSSQFRKYGLWEYVFLIAQIYNEQAKNKHLLQYHAFTVPCIYSRFFFLAHSICLHLLFFFFFVLKIPWVCIVWKTTPTLTRLSPYTSIPLPLRCVSALKRGQEWVTSAEWHFIPVLWTELNIHVSCVQIFIYQFCDVLLCGCITFWTIL